MVSVQEYVTEQLKKIIMVAQILGILVLARFVCVSVCLFTDPAHHSLVD